MLHAFSDGIFHSSGAGTSIEHRSAHGIIGAAMDTIDEVVVTFSEMVGRIPYAP